MANPNPKDATETPAPTANEGPQGGNGTVPCPETSGSPAPADNPASSLDSADLYINRELSWLEFNRRVLEEAQDPEVPLLERLKFLAIYSANLDEFFMVRVASLKQKVASGITSSSGGDRLLPKDQVDRIAKIVHEQVAIQVNCLRNDILPELANHGVQILRRRELTQEEQNYVDDLFSREIFPVLTPMAIDPSHPFPHLLNRSLNLVIRLRRPKQSKILLAVVQVPAVLPRFLVIPDREGHNFIPLENVIRRYLKQLFPGMDIVDSYVFRVTRDTDFDLDDYEEIKDLIQTIERQIRDRRMGASTRLEIEDGAPAELIEDLKNALFLDENDIYLLPRPLDLTGLFEILNLPGFQQLRDPDYVPRVETSISSGKSLWSAIREGDILLHHPYDSFKPVVDFINMAADDPKVLAIKQTLYRTSSDSPFISALQRAAGLGKQVTALVELQARLDEERNIVWARKLEKAGVHVVYGFVGLKTHCKAALVVRRDDDRIRRYVHLATGNYNPQTARVYTDLGILTCNEGLADDASALFNYLTGYSELPSWNKLLIAPSRLRNFIIERIEHEASLGERGRIVAKVNAILEQTVIRALYKASQAGVQIDLICRGICGLRPGIPGISENIRVHSIVDRFLEHSRIYYFGNNGSPYVYIASADWMDRNLIRRIEVAIPVEDETLKSRVIELLSISLHDNVKSRKLQPDGSWQRVVQGPNEPRIRSQQVFLDLALNDHACDGIPDSALIIDRNLNQEVVKSHRHRRRSDKKKSTT